ncbi:MAG: hypothetical protein AB1609_12640 [Bacillota bacterium]
MQHDASQGRRKYRLKPVIVEAEQWWPDKPVPGVLPTKGSTDSLDVAFAQAMARGLKSADEFWTCGYIRTALGACLVMPGDWVVTEPDGSRKVLTPEQFEAAYEPVPEIPLEVLAGPKDDRVVRLVCRAV